jgi:hypothetical protein
MLSTSKPLVGMYCTATFSILESLVLASLQIDLTKHITMTRYTDSLLLKLRLLLTCCSPTALKMASKTCKFVTYDPLTSVLGRCFSFTGAGRSEVTGVCSALRRSLPRDT